jgi:hypothetical protein
VAQGYDWVNNFQTVVDFEGELIGPRGRAELQILPSTAAEVMVGQDALSINVHAGSGLAAESVVVYTGAAPLEKTGLAQTMGGINIIGRGGFNSALQQNYEAGAARGFEMGAANAIRGINRGLM